jgi:FkbM family methyltransferase
LEVKNEMSRIPLARRGRHIFLRGVQAAEWGCSKLILGRAPWTKNRFLQRYQAMCFADYKHLWHGNPEMVESLWMERNLREGNVVLDVGANHGIVSLECALFVGPTGKVHAFEPAPRTHACLLRHLKINNIQNVSVFDAAVGATAGSARLRVYEHATGLATLSESDPDHVADEVIEVKTITLDEHCDAYGISTVDLLKIDIEGHELFALRGARRMLSSKRVRAILLEVGDDACRNAKVDPWELLSDLEDLGYALFSILSSGEAGDRISHFPRSPNGRNYLALPTLML